MSSRLISAWCTSCLYLFDMIYSKGVVEISVRGILTPAPLTEIVPGRDNHTSLKCLKSFWKRLIFRSSNRTRIQFLQQTGKWALDCDPPPTKENKAESTDNVWTVEFQSLALCSFTSSRLEQFSTGNKPKMLWVWGDRCWHLNVAMNAWKVQKTKKELRTNCSFSLMLTFSFMFPFKWCEHKGKVNYSTAKSEDNIILS